MSNIINLGGKEKRYSIELPDGSKLKLWFIGSQLEKILKAYKIPYKIEKR